MKKVLAILFTLAFLFGSALAENELVTLENYADFSFDLPGGYEFQYGDLYHGDYEKHVESAYFETTLSIQCLSEFDTIEEAVEEYLLSISEWDRDGVKCQDVDLDEMSAILLILPDTEESQRDIFFSCNGICYLITMHNLYELSSDDLADWEAIIESITPNVSEASSELNHESLDLSAYSTLEKGSKGESVVELQERLIELHYLVNGSADGDYGNKTKTAVEKFQDTAGMEITGIADPLTQAKLFSEDAPEAKLSISCSSVVIGSSATTTWYVDGQEFTLKGSQTKTLETSWGTYKFDAYGNYEKLN